MPPPLSLPRKRGREASESERVGVFLTPVLPASITPAIQKGRTNDVPAGSETGA
jgi:hypothetical protein